MSYSDGSLGKSLGKLSRELSELVADLVTGGASQDSTSGRITSIGGSSSALSETVSQASHGFTVGALTPVRRSGGVFIASLADAAAHADVAGIAVASDANTFTLYYTGSKITTTGLTDGADYFLSASGGITTTEPSTAGQVSVFLGTADGTTALLFDSTRGLVIPSSAITYLVVKLVDDSTSITTGEGKFQFVIDADLAGKSLAVVRATCTTAPTGSALSFGIRKNSTEMLSTNSTIDTTKKSSDSSATPAVIKSDGSQTVAQDDVISIDCDQADSNSASRGSTIKLGFQ